MIELDEALNFSLTMFEALRRLGYPADAIYFSTALVHPARIAEGRGPGIVLKFAGKTFNIAAGAVREPEAAIVARWQERAAWWNKATNAEQDAIYEANKPEQGWSSLVVALLAKGFPPREEFPATQRPGSA